MSATIRRVQPADAAALRAFYAALSPDSRRARFLGWSAGPSGAQSITFCTPDHVHAEGFVALSESPADAGTILGHLCLEPFGVSRLELALAVADHDQGSGIGRALFQAALDWATARGYQSLVATCLADNSRVLSLLRSTPYPAWIAAADAGVVDVYVPLQAPLPADWNFTAPFNRPRRRRPVRTPIRVPSRAVWRRTRPPERDAEG